MSTALEAENYIKNYFKDKRNTQLIKSQYKESGFDFRDEKSTIFVEVKGTKETKLSKVLFRYFTNAQYQKAKDCIRNKIQYEIHLVLGINSSTVQHYLIPTKYFIENAIPETTWYLPMIKEIEKFKLK